MARSVRLSSDEAWAVLEQAHTGVLTSVRRDGRPISLPVWFVVLDRCIYVAGPEHTKKFARVRHDPRVSFVVESGVMWAELVGVHVSGQARFVEPGPHLARVAAALDEKYERFRTPREEMPATTRAHYDTPTATIEIVPDDRILSWDNARLFAPEPT
jgi:nitroimidazol reductase NimA-like FMN-containing flavoprotein (pyridoxamine 5'-phosphate oxidase superfamily)